MDSSPHLARIEDTMQHGSRVDCPMQLVAKFHGPHHVVKAGERDEFRFQFSLAGPVPGQRLRARKKRMRREVQASSVWIKTAEVHERLRQQAGFLQKLTTRRISPSSSVPAGNSQVKSSTQGRY